MMDGNAGQPARDPGEGWVPVPDPTELTTAAVERATDVFRREIKAVRETLETRLDAADEDRARVWERLRDLPALYETFTQHLREELFRQDAHDREVIVQRLDDLDVARRQAIEDFHSALSAAESQHEHLRADRNAAIAAVKDLLEQRISGMDQALKLMAGETARALAAAETGDNRTRGDTRDMVTALKDLIEQRLSAMDLATRVLAGSVDKFPSDLDRAVSNGRDILIGEIKRVQAVTEEKFTAIDGTFSSNALALTAALAAQKEAAAEQNKSNTLAITKSESSTKETIAANAVQAQTGLASLENQFDDLKERVVRIESSGAGIASVTGSPFDSAALAQEARIAQEARQRAALAIVISAVLALVAIASLIFAVVKK